jgi:hypothetical protein
MSKASEVLAAVEAAGQNTQKLPDFLEHFYRLAGGPSSSPSCSTTSSWQAPAGSLARQRILDLVIKTTKVQDDKSAASSLDGMADADILHEIEAILRQAGVQLGTQAVGGPGDAAAAAAPAAPPQPPWRPGPPAGPVPGGGGQAP